MKERLLQLLDLEQITSSKFADIIGVQRSSVSHVISGRNKPSFDFLQKTLKAFPGLNASWLMLGEGSMYEQMGRKVTGNLFDAPGDLPEDSIPENIADEEAGGEQISPSQIASSEAIQDAEQAEAPVNTDEGTEPEIKKDIQPQANKEAKRVVQVMVFYDDDTFRTYSPDR